MPAEFGVGRKGDMSATNWGTCPRCRATFNAERAAAIVKVAESYGKVAVEEYERLRAEASREWPNSLGLREDYEMGINEHGLFYVHYSGACVECGFQYDYAHTEETETSPSTGKATADA